MRALRAVVVAVVLAASLPASAEERSPDVAAARSRHDAARDHDELPGAAARSDSERRKHASRAGVEISRYAAGGRARFAAQPARRAMGPSWNHHAQRLAVDATKDRPAHATGFAARN